MSENKPVKGYKVFNPDWTCKGFQYKVGESYEMNEAPIACVRGFHFCEKLADCFDYYEFNKENKVAEVTAYGEVVREDKIDNKCCTNKIKIKREITWDKVLNMVNMGSHCDGLGNTGNFNTGNFNVSHFNKGNGNAGSKNTGDYNTGNYNVGNYNAGDCNEGDANTGNANEGDFNTGSYNIGHWNVGNFNKGKYNIGDCNIGCYYYGCFNTENTQERKMSFFNKVSEWTMSDWLISEARTILQHCVLISLASDENFRELELTQKEIFQKQQKNWNKLTKKQKETVMAIPNFDKEIFKQITGIDVDMEG